MRPWRLRFSLAPASAMIGMVIGAAAPAALASPALVAIAWSTYLRAGPSETSEAIDELEHDMRVVVASCDARWCRVSAGSTQGYVDRDALTLPRTLPPSPPANSDCVVVGQADNRGPIGTRFCSPPPPPPAPSPAG